MDSLWLAFMDNKYRRRDCMGRAEQERLLREAGFPSSTDERRLLAALLIGITFVTIIGQTV